MYSVLKRDNKTDRIVLSKSWIYMQKSGICVEMHVVGLFSRFLNLLAIFRGDYC